MTKEETLLLKNLLIKFFDEANFGAPNYLVRNPIASLLKKRLLELGHWRNRARNKNPKQFSALFRKPVSKIQPVNDPNDCPF